MIRIEITENQMEYCLTMTGHAGYNPGNDIVCAAASILGQTAVQLVYDMESDGQVEVAHDIVRDGKIYLKVNALPGWETVMKERLKFIKTGFELIHQEYEKHVKLGWVEM